MIEVEIKLPAADLKWLEQQLLAAGFQNSGSEQECDVYFDNARGEIRGSGGALRVRETAEGSGGRIRAQINWKGKKLDARTMTRQELETGVEDGAVCRKILQALGYFPVEPEVRKNRTMLRKGPVTACLDQVQGLGGFLELEILAEGDREREAALERLWQILEALGYQETDTVNSSYLSMLQRKIYGKQDEK